MELYMVCVLVALALAMAIIKSAQFVISLMYPLPDPYEIQWGQNPSLSLVEHRKKQKNVRQQSSKAVKHQQQLLQQQQNALKQVPVGRRPPRNIRIEQLYSSSPLSFDEIDSSFGRRSYIPQTTPGSARGVHRPSSRYDEMAMMNMSIGSAGRDSFQQRIPLDHIDFVEDDDDLEDPIEAYVQEQHQRMLREQQQLSSTPIQSPYSRPSKSHATIV